MTRRYECAVSQVRSQLASVTPRKLVTALEILRFYADVYANAGYNLALAVRKFEAKGNRDARYERTATDWLKLQLKYLQRKCADLPVSAVAIKQILDVLKAPPVLAALPVGQLGRMLASVQATIEGELSTKLFFRLQHERSEFFKRPTKGWKKILERFPKASTDVEEMHKCFALSRYAAAVFHSVQSIELSLLELGKFLNVEDPKSGWTAVSNKLDKLMKGKFDELSEYHQKHFAFIEQMQATVIALQRAWRNKISHAQGKLVLMTSEFSPDVAEEIIMATRAFMRRLATELPHPVTTPSA